MHPYGQKGAWSGYGGQGGQGGGQQAYGQGGHGKGGYGGAGYGQGGGWGQPSYGAGAPGKGGYRPHGGRGAAAPPPPATRAQKSAGPPRREMDSLLEEMKARQRMQEQKKEMEKREQAQTTAEASGGSGGDFGSGGGFGSSAPAAGGGFGSYASDSGPPRRGGSGGAAVAVKPLFLGELASSTTEDTLCQLFTQYGTVVSVVIARDGQKMQGYVTLDTRENAQRAKEALADREVDGVPLSIEWASGPPPVAQLDADSKDGRHVVVEPPADEKRRRIIDRLAKYVAQEGQALEQIIMERETPEGNLGFLFNPGSKENVYYRWRAFAFAQGDNFKIWREETFRVFEGGAWWQPPPCEGPNSNKRNTNFSSAGPAIVRRPASVAAPKEGAAPARAAAPAPVAKGPRPGWTPEDEEEERLRLRLEERATQERQRRDRDKKGLAGGKRLTDQDWDVLERLLRTVSGARCTVLEAMAFCLDHSDMAIEITECITQALTILETDLTLKVSRLLVVSDVLHNTASSQKSAWAYRREFEKSLPDILEHFQIALSRAESRLQAEKAKEQVARILKVWEDWGLFAPSFIRGLEAALVVGVKRLRFLASRGDGSREPTWLQPKLTDWRKQHFSQLEKMCRTRGLRFSTAHLEAKQGVSLEDARKEWLLDRLVAYELHWHEKEQARLAASAGSLAGRRGSGEDLDGEAVECDIDGFPLDETELDGVRMSSNDWADILQMFEASTQSGSGKSLGGGATMVYSEGTQLQASLDGGAPACDEAVGEAAAPDGAAGTSASATAGDGEAPADPTKSEPVAAMGAGNAAEADLAPGSKMSLQDINLEVTELRASLVLQGLHQDAIEDICDEKRQRLMDERDGKLASPPRLASPGGDDDSDQQEKEEEQEPLPNKEVKAVSSKQAPKEPEKDREKEKKAKEDRAKEKDKAQKEPEKEKTTEKTPTNARNALFAPPEKDAKGKREKEKDKDKEKRKEKDKDEDKEKQKLREKARQILQEKERARSRSKDSKDEKVAAKDKRRGKAGDDRDRDRDKDRDRGKKERQKAREPSRSRSHEQRGKKSRR